LPHLRSLTPRNPRSSRRRSSLVIAIVLALASVVLAQPAPDPQSLVADLGSQDRATVERTVATVERLITTPENSSDLANVLFRAARACEDTLADPKRALALYERITREIPNARIATSAERRVGMLRAQVGASGEHGDKAAELARLVASADTLAADEIERRAQVLVVAAWPGAPEAALWLAEWLRRTGRLDDAQRRYDEVVTRWPGTSHALLAIRGGAGNALDNRDWNRAEALAEQLPAVEEADRIVRDNLLGLARRGRKIDGWYTRAWVIAMLGCAVMLGSLIEASRHGGWQRPRMWPPIEVAFLAPVAAVMVGVALTTHQLIAPAVLILSIGGLVLAWVSGSTLDTLKARGRSVRGRAVFHVFVCLFTVAALLYVALVRDNLLEMVIETVRFGPEP
jgi:hypothetical protein